VSVDLRAYKKYLITHLHEKIGDCFCASFARTSYVASAGSAEEKTEIFKKICSNRRLAYASLSVSYSYPYKILTERNEQELGSLYQKVRTYFKGYPLK